jgi:eukaryotic translation initiation factor 2C
MIKFAVTRPKERLVSIKNGINMLKWHQDPFLKHYGVQIDPNMTQTKALVLPPPEVQYDKAKATPGYSGRWDLRGKKFLFPNTEPLKSWGVVVVGACLQESDVRNFMNLFIQIYTGHGGKIENKNPTIYIGQRNQDLGELVVAARKATGDAAKLAPQILFFVLPGRDSFMYERLKRNNECRFALVSQSKSSH